MKTDKMQLLEERRGKSIQQILQDELESGKSFVDIAASLGISRPCLYAWLEELGASIELSRRVTFGCEPVGAIAGNMGAK